MSASWAVSVPPMRTLKAAAVEYPLEIDMAILFVITRYATAMISPDHPLAEFHGTRTHGHVLLVYAHRLVLWNVLGPGLHPCYWCGRPLRWARGHEADVITTDHLNDEPRDNRPENLVASCRGCNGGRAIRLRRSRTAIRSDEEWLTTRTRNGVGRCRATRLVCEVCGASFLANTSRVKRGTVRVCSRSCSGNLGATAKWAVRS